MSGVVHITTLLLVTMVYQSALEAAHWHIAQTTTKFPSQSMNDDNNRPIDIKLWKHSMSSQICESQCKAQQLCRTPLRA